MLTPYLEVPLAEYGQQGLVGQDVDQAGRTAAGAVQPLDGAGGKQLFAPITGHPQAVGHVGRHLATPQSGQAVMEGDSLSQLPDFRHAQFFVQLRLSQDDPLQQFAFFCFQIGKQAQGLQTLQRHGLGLVDADHGGLALPGDIQQTLVEGLEQVVLIDIRRHLQPQFLCQGQVEGTGLEVGVGQIGGNELVAQILQETAAEQRLAGADLPGDLDESFSRTKRHQKGIQGLLVAGGGIDETGVGRNPEWILHQSEMLQIHDAPPAPADVIGAGLSGDRNRRGGTGCSADRTASRIRSG